MFVQKVEESEVCECKEENEIEGEEIDYFEQSSLYIKKNIWNNGFQNKKNQWHALNMQT